MTENATAVCISVVVPMFNAERLIEQCLAPILAMLERGEIEEIVVVDDSSTDRSAQIVGTYPAVRLVSMAAQGGPGAARNCGAEVALGTHLWFVDADVVVADDAARVLRAVLTADAVAAVIGSYDDRPAATNFLSQYKNLVHHYYHQRGRQQASTFWAGCGTVERSLFQRLGGFDALRYRYPSIEDIDLGYRIIDAGGRIVLEPKFQGKHLKEWRLRNLLHTEIFRRALPWARLMLERRDVTNDLNLGRAERARAILAFAFIASALLWLAGLCEGLIPAVLAVALVLANMGFLAFFTRARGPLFALRAFVFHQLYYVYSSAAFALAVVQHALIRVRSRPDSAA